MHSIISSEAQGTPTLCEVKVRMRLIPMHAYNRSPWEETSWPF